ncbi:MAG: hypothetical protein LBI02_11255 [Opitutaceae bacterium]|nr:hypothetical protein [Opitutaceae bacterium]
MKKQTPLPLIAAAIFPVVFNVCWFALVAEHTPARWVCHAAIHLAYLFLLASAFSMNAQRDAAVHSYPKLGTAFGLFSIILFLGIIFAQFRGLSPTVPIVTFAIIAGICLLVYIFLMKAETHTAAADAALKQDTAFIKNCSEQLREIMAGVSDRRLKKELEKVHDAIGNAQIVSTAEAAAFENDLARKISELGRLVYENPGAAAALVPALLGIIRRRDAAIRMAR